MNTQGFALRDSLVGLGPQSEREPLTSLEAQLLQVAAKARELPDDEQLDSLGQELDSLESRICKTVSPSAAGIAVKVRQLWECARESADAEDYENLCTILESLEALAQRTPES